MKRLAVVVLMLSVLVFSNVHVSKAESEIPTTYTITCNSITITGAGGEMEPSNGGYVELYDSSTDQYLVEEEFEADYGEPYSVTFYFIGEYEPGDAVELELYDYNGEIYREGTIPPCTNDDEEDDCPIFTDGRLNDCDAGQTAAVYCNDDGSVKVLAIFKGEGYPAFTATEDEIAAVPTHPAKNTLIKSGNGAFLYRLTSGLLQVNRAEDGTGKVYSFRFTCD
jgi:hypothetical protein